MREQRVAEAIKEEISDILRTQLKDPRIGFVSVTGVEVTNDLRQAKVHVSVMGTEQEKEQAIKVLQKATGFIRSELAGRLTLRYTPELLFRLDKSIDHGLRIAKLLNEIQEQGQQSRSEPDESKR